MAVVAVADVPAVVQVAAALVVVAVAVVAVRLVLSAVPVVRHEKVVSRSARSATNTRQCRHLPSSAALSCLTVRGKAFA